MSKPGRTYTSNAYRYGFQGQEKDDEVKGEGNSIAFKYRVHDPRLNRFLSVDPLSPEYPWYSPYQFSGNKVIYRVELEGLEEEEPWVSSLNNPFRQYMRRRTPMTTSVLEGIDWLSGNFKEFFWDNKKSGNVNCTECGDDVLDQPSDVKISDTKSNCSDCSDLNLPEPDGYIETGEVLEFALAVGSVTGLKKTTNPKSVGKPKLSNTSTEIVAKADKAHNKVQTSTTPTKPRRPYLRKNTIEETFENNRNAEGDVIDPSGKKIKWDKAKPRGKQWEMGHKPGKEFWRDWKEFTDGKISWKELTERYNDPTRYRPELPETNRSHKFEDKSKPLPQIE